MITFFRKIRRKLLSEHKFSKYLAYATGEIILVVIGILIALSINNWNLVQQDRKVEKANLLALQKEFLQNRTILQEVVQLNSQNIIGAEKMIQSFGYEYKDTISEQTMAIYAAESFGSEINFAPETGVLTEILSSGELKLIQNDELKHKLAGFNSKLDKIEQQEREVYEYRMMGIDYMMHEGNLEKAYVDLGVREEYINTAFANTGNRSMLNSLPFLNQLVLYQASAQVTSIRFYHPLDKEIEIVLELISDRLAEL